MTPDVGISGPESALIRSKLERPPLPGGLVVRQRLLDLMREGSGGRIALIAAPAGYGKSTLALQFLERWRGEVAWLSLDPAESDPYRFARYVVAALQRVCGTGFRRSQGLLQARTSPPWTYFCEALVAELEELPARTVLVLEDYHTLTSPEVHQLVETMVERSPRALHVAVMTRVDPPWPLARWRARGWLTELRARDLLFSTEEAVEFFGSATELTLSPATVRILQQRTEGWVAGLRLAQLSLSESADPDRDGRELSGTDRQIADYLIDEVLTSQPSDVLEFLAASALLERFSAPLMDHLLADGAETDRARRILSRLEKHNLFLVPLDTRRKWYRWHHLFRDLLVDHLRHRVPEGFRDRVHRASGAWFAGEGLVEEALRHWIAAGELDAAADLVGAHLYQVIDEDMSCRRLGEWLSMFPPGATQSRLPLLVAHGYCRIVRWDLTGLEALLREAEAVRPSEPRGPGRGDAALLRADVDAQWSFLLYWRGDVAGSLERSRPALDAGPPVGSKPWMIASIYQHMALALRGRNEEAVRCSNAAIAAAGPGSPHVADLLMAQAASGLYALDLDACRARSEQMLELRERVPVADYRFGQAPYMLGAIAYEQDRLDAAEAWFRRLEELRFLMPTRIFQDALLGLALVALARNDGEALRSRCEEARAFATETGDPTSLAILESFESRVALLRGHRSARGSAPPPADDHQSPWLEVPTVTWAMHLIDHDDPRLRASALDFIEEALARVERYHNRRVAFPLSVLRAVALDVRGRRDEALELMARVVNEAAERGLVRSVVDHGPRVKELLDALVGTRSCSGDYLTTLRGAFGSTEPRRSPSPPTDSAWGPLTFRERETLELLARRMTNKEIAGRLSVSSAAVKKRLESIYAKLGVADRRSAVAEAVARGLIRAPRESS